MNPPLISSQRYLNRALVAHKAATFKVFVVRTVDVELRGRLYRVLLDGHHALAAARARGVEPCWRRHDKTERMVKRIGAGAFAKTMINNLTDSDWYFVDTGEVVADLLGVER